MKRFWIGFLCCYGLAALDRGYEQLWISQMLSASDCPHVTMLGVVELGLLWPAEPFYTMAGERFLLGPWGFSMGTSRCR